MGRSSNGPAPPPGFARHLPMNGEELKRNSPSAGLRPAPPHEWGGVQTEQPLRRASPRHLPMNGEEFKRASPSAGLRPAPPHEWGGVQTGQPLRRALPGTSP